MVYQSIIRVLQFAAVDVSNTSEVSVARIRKQLNAEFAMAESGMLLIDDIHYNKHDVMEEIERPDFVERLSYHQKVWEHKALLELLEKDSIDIYESYKEWYALHQEPGFVHFLSPYFAFSFNSVMKTLLHMPHFSEATNWLKFTVFLEPLHEEQAYEATRLFLSEQLHLFNNVNKDTFYRHINDIRMWEREPWGDFINQLPDALFTYIDDIGVAIINFTAQVQRTERDMCERMSFQLMRLTRISPENRKIIQDNHRIFTKQGASSSSTNVSIGSILFGIAFVLKLLFALGNCNGQSLTPTNVYYNYDPHQDTLWQQEQGKYLLDSVTSIPNAQ